MESQSSKPKRNFNCWDIPRERAMAIALTLADRGWRNDKISRYLLKCGYWSVKSRGPLTPSGISTLMNSAKQEGIKPLSQEEMTKVDAGVQSKKDPTPMGNSAIVYTQPDKRDTLKKAVKAISAVDSMSAEDKLAIIGLLVEEA